MRTKTRAKYEQIRAIRDDYNKQCKQYEEIAHNEVDMLLSYIDKQKSKGFKGLNYILESAKNSIEFEMLDIDDIKDNYSYLLESGTCREIAEEKVLKMLRRLMIG